MQNKNQLLLPSNWLNHIKLFLSKRFQRQAVWQDLRDGIWVWLVFVLFLALVQFSVPDMPDNDGFYHIKLAYLMRTEGLKPEFTWLPLSILNAREYYDHHFLFHVALIPFTFGDLRIGAKLAAVLFASLAFLGFWKVLKNQHIPYAYLWALGLTAISEAFIYRMSITRAQSLSLLVLMVGVDWLLRRKYYRLAGLAFVYVWLYNAFPLLAVVAGVYVLASWIVERKLNLLPLLVVVVGTVLGLLINPYFPHNITFAVQHILPKLIETTEISVGNEWYPYNTLQLLKNSPLALAAFISGALALGLQDRRMDLRTMVGFLLAGLFGLMLFQSRRFIEYFPPFALLFAVFAWTPLIERAAPYRWRRLSVHLPVLVIVLMLLAGGAYTYNGAKTSIQTSKAYQTYDKASAWLASNTPAGARVFQTDWDDFPRLFYYNTHNTYLIGLDPTYMSIYDQDLYDLWVSITQGEVKQPAGQILGQFGAEYVITDLRHKDFLKQAEVDPGMIERYRDRDAVVYQVVLESQK